MDKSNKGKRIMAQGAPEPPGPVNGVIDFTGSPLSCNWKNDEGKVGPKTSPLALIATGDLSHIESDVDAGSTRSGVTRPANNSSHKKSKKEIGLQTGSTLAEISIIPIIRKGNVKEPNWKR
jgi:hypothetical protein